MYDKASSLYLCNLKNMVLKKLTLFLFFVMPQRLTRVFVNLSLISLIFHVRDISLQEDAHTLDRVGKMLKIHLNKKILILPQRTLMWYWSDEVMCSQIVSRGERHSVLEILQDNDLFMKNRQIVTDHLLDALPKSISIKLGLNQVHNRLFIKHNIASALMYR